jgi:hypothetical protein
MPKRREASSSRASVAAARIGRVIATICVVLWPLGARAATVALLEPASDTPAINEALFRLQGELLAVGASVVFTARPPVLEGDAEPQPDFLEHLARERNVDAFVDVRGSDTPVAADVWIYERSPPRLVRARVTLEPGADNRAATLAIRTIEVLRSSFLARELGAEARPLAPVPAPTPPATDVSVERPSDRARFGFEAGATALTSFDGVSPALLPLLRGEWGFDSWLSLQLTLAAFGTEPRVETSAGDVTVRRDFAALGVCACRRSVRGVHPFFALAAGALHTAVDGEANTPSVGHHESQWAALVDATAGARFGWSDRFYVSAAAQLQLAAPYVAIHVVDTVVATTGRPNLLFTLTAGARP